VKSKQLSGEVTSLAQSHDGKFLTVTAGKEVVFFNTKTYDLLPMLHINSVILFNPT
jgi:hypothetical protein